MKIWMLAVTIVLLSAPVSAQVNRCEGLDGPVYQQQPCAGEGEAIRGISVTPGASQEQQRAMERERLERQRAASKKRQQRIDDAGNKVRQIQQENADPEKCAAAKARLALISDIEKSMGSQDVFEYRSMIRLYCNP